MKPSASLLLPALMWAGAACGQSHDNSLTSNPTDSVAGDSVVSDSLKLSTIPFDSIPEADKATRYTELSEEDFRIAAEQLGIEVAAIKAVVSIEAGKQMKGFYAPGVPVVNFDQSMYRAHAGRAVNKAGDKNATVPAGLSGYALREWTQLVNARKRNCEGANMGTFWGMFQIGGFNYKLCGCKSVNEFVEAMSESEFAQLELFVRFISNTDMVKYLKNKNWAGFARRYNGPGYARRGYHTRMAAAYKKFKNQ